MALSQSGIGARRAASLRSMLRSLSRLACLSAGLLAAGCLSAPLYESGGSVDLVVAATTDVHGYLRGWDYYSNRPDTLRGLARAATVVDSLRRVSSPWPVLVDAGDMLQGTPLAYAAARIDTTMPNPVMMAMNAMQY